jgi:putative protein kinase ArgK-like GTPase of G3E family
MQNALTPFALRITTRYEKISEECEGTFQWLWTHKTYQMWSSSNGSDVLLIQGKPGSRKSTLTKYFKRHLLERASQAGQIVVTFFYSYREGDHKRIILVC